MRNYTSVEQALILRLKSAFSYYEVKGSHDNSNHFLKPIDTYGHHQKAWEIIQNLNCLRWLTPIVSGGIELGTVPGIMLNRYLGLYSIDISFNAHIFVKNIGVVANASKESAFDITDSNTRDLLCLLINKESNYRLSIGKKNILRLKKSEGHIQLAFQPLGCNTDVEIDCNPELIELSLCSYYLYESAFLLGIVEGAMSEMIQRAKERQLFGRQQIEFQAVSHTLSKVIARHSTTWQAILETARRMDSQFGDPIESANLLLFSIEFSQEAIRSIIQLHGSMGLLESSFASHRYRIISDYQKKHFTKNFLQNTGKRVLEDSHYLSSPQTSSFATERYANIIVDQSRLPKDFMLNLKSRGEYPALSFQNEITSYANLSVKVNNLTNILRKEKITNSDMIEIWGGRHPDLVIALLAAWDIGSTVIIRDYNEPRNMKDIRDNAIMPTVCILAPEGSFQSFHGRQRLTLWYDQTKSSWELDRSTTYEIRNQFISSEIAYLHFTSGTKGIPKIIAGSESSVFSYINWHINEFRFNSKTRFAMLSALGHDPLFRDILTPLFCGGGLMIPDVKIRNDPERLFDWLLQTRVNVLHVTPRFLESMLSASKDRELPDLTHVFIGGDILMYSTVRNFQKISPSCQIFNVYGATETPQIVSMYKVTDIVDKQNKQFGIVPIGRGVNGASLRINVTANSDLNQKKGEIEVQTSNLALGCITEAGLMPIGANAKEIEKYRTGDIGEVDSDGNIICHGRFGETINMGGERIQLSEIVAALRSHPMIYDCVVQFTQDLNSHSKLVAYYVLQKSATSIKEDLLISELRVFLRDWLPTSVIPNRFYKVKEIPLTHNGKTDFVKLREIYEEKTQLNINSNLEENNDHVEYLISIWKDIMRIEEIDADSDFFAIGGHSLQAVLIVNLINRKFRLQIPPAVMWTHSKVRSLAKKIEEQLLLTKI